MKVLFWKTFLCSTLAVVLSGPAQAKKDEPTQPDLTSPRTLFVTSLSYTGDLVSEAMAYGYSGSDGLMAADAICNAHAMNAGLPGNFVAILSSSEENANARVTTSLGPFRWVDGTPVAENYAALFNTFDGSAGMPPRRLISPVRMTELGTLVFGGGPDTTAWTGSTAVGGERQFSPGPVGESRPDLTTCNDWTDDAVAAGCEVNDNGPCAQIGANQLNSTQWLMQDIGFCSVGRTLYCAQK